MSFISDILFGKKVKFVDETLGTFLARVRNRHSLKSRTWMSEHIVANQKKATVIILEGTSDGPHTEHLESVYKIVGDLDSIKDKIEKDLRASQGGKNNYNLSWRTDFYLACISPWQTGYEISFEPNVEGDRTHYVSCVWKNANLDEIVSK